MHETRGRVRLVLGRSDDPDGFIERIEDLLEAVQDVDALLQLRQFIFQSAYHDLHPEIKEIPEYSGQIYFGRRSHFRIVRRQQARHVDVESHLQRGVLQQEGHGGLGLHTALDLQDDPDIIGGFIPDIDQLGHFALDDVVGNLLDQGAFGHAIRDGRDDDSRFALEFILPAQLDGAFSGGVDVDQLRLRIEDAPPCREIGAGDELLDQRLRASIRRSDHVDGRIHQLRKVVGWNIGGHPDSDTGGPIEQQVGYPGRKHDRFEQGSVEVGSEGYRFLLDLRQELHGQRTQPGFRVSHGRRGVPIERPEVSVAIHEGSAQRKLLRHAHHGIINGRIAVGMVLPHDLPNDRCTLLVTSVRIQMQVGVHRIENATLNGLQTVPDIG